jgi:hypothetical protein
VSTAALIAFLNARLDEDERVALNASVGPWRARRADRSVYAAESAVVNMPGPLPDWATYIVPPDSEGSDGIEPADAEHIARWDPDRVLAEVEAKRELVEEHQPAAYGECRTCREPGLDRNQAAPCLTLRLLALPYADHPDYREEWRP